MPTESCQRGAAPVRLLLGLLVVTLGVIFLGANLGWFDEREVLRQFWPTAFLLIGVVVLLQPRPHGSRWWGLAWIVAGSWILAQHRGWVTLSFGDVVFPAILLLIGGRLVWRAVGGGRRRRQVPEAREPQHDEVVADEDYVHALGLLSGNVVRAGGRTFRGAELTAFMGGVNFDLSGARAATDEVVIDVLAVWGGIEIRVPPEWTVTSRVTPILGGFEDKTRPTGAAGGTRVVVRGLVVMGGVEVKS